MKKLSLIFILTMATIGLSGCANNSLTGVGADNSNGNQDPYWGRSKENDDNPY